jgi:dimethylaniline monooxygenase (N-oxide forming)
VRQRPDFSHSGQWEVVTENREGQEERHTFDSVIVCSGHYSYPHLPLKDFSGQQNQSTNKNHFLNKKVLYNNLAQTPRARS